MDPAGDSPKCAKRHLQLMGHINAVCRWMEKTQSVVGNDDVWPLLLGPILYDPLFCLNGLVNSRQLQNHSPPKGVYAIIDPVRRKINDRQLRKMHTQQFFSKARSAECHGMSLLQQRGNHGDGTRYMPEPPIEHSKENFPFLTAFRHGSPRYPVCLSQNAGGPTFARP